MYRLQTDSVHEIEIKKSRFITYLHKVSNEQDAKDYILAIKKLHPNANHHCYAFVIGEHNEIQRSNDDKEPSGTAGVPILESLLRLHMQDIVAVVVRYFGGIKLGTGGLIRAYSKSVSTALQNAFITQKQTMQQFRFQFSYDVIGKIDYFFRSEAITILKKDYQENVEYTFLCQHDLSKQLQEITCGNMNLSKETDIVLDVLLQEHPFQ